MKVFNTSSKSSGNYITNVLNKIQKAGVKPAAISLFRKIAPQLMRLLALGKPSLQIFGRPFDYDSHLFSFGISWTYPDWASDGIDISFMIEENGKGFHFMLLDHQLPISINDMFLTLPTSISDAVDTVLAYVNSSNSLRTPLVP